MAREPPRAAPQLRPLKLCSRRAEAAAARGGGGAAVAPQQQLPGIGAKARQLMQAGAPRRRRGGGVVDAVAALWHEVLLPLLTAHQRAVAGLVAFQLLLALIAG
jgi:hypothetical protein